MQWVQRRGGSILPLIPQLTKWASRGKDITQPNIIPLVFFFLQGATRELSHLSSPKMPIVSLHQENFSELTDFFNASVVFFKVSTFTSVSVSVFTLPLSIKITLSAFHTRCLILISCISLGHGSTDGRVDFSFYPHGIHLLTSFHTFDSMIHVYFQSISSIWS